MIKFTEIKTIIIELMRVIDCPIIRLDQPGKQPDFPYGTYNILSDNPERGHQNYYYYTNRTNYKDKNVTEKTRTVLSFAFYDRNVIDVIADKVKKSLEWFASIDGMGFCIVNGFAVNAAGPVQDRSIFIEDLYWRKSYGFDMNFDSSNQRIDSVEKIKKIALHPNYAGVDQPIIIIQE